MADLPRCTSATVTSAVTITAQTETLVLNSVSLPVPYNSEFAFILGFGQVTVGAAQTSVTPRIRRGAGITGTLVGVASPLTAVAANLMEFVCAALDTLQNQDSAQYSLTLQQLGGAGGNGSVPFATIVVLLL